MRLELGANFRADRVAALTNARPDGSTKIARRAGELAPHFADALLDDPCDCAAPACMKRADDALLHVCDQHRNAIGRLDCQQHTGDIRDHAVAGRRVLDNVVYAMSDGGMDLPNLRQRPEALILVGRTDGFEKQCAIAFDILVCVVRGESKVQRLAAVAGRNAALPCAESVYEPSDIVQRIRVQDFDRCSLVLRGFATSFAGDWHSSILANFVSLSGSTTDDKYKDKELNGAAKRRG